MSNLSFLPNSISYKREAVSKYGNLKINYKLGNTCTGYTSNNCANICFAIKYVETYEYKNGLITCINGADDLKTCEKCLIFFQLNHR
ncbi:hypothetical protein HZS_5120 [Henneguya salminicola]|nr:hypothetical protein HZS_5120 [Henneguya salminicola]